MAQPARKNNCSTYADYLRWTEGSWELLNGVVYDMTPAPSRQHQKVSILLATLIHNQLSETPCEVYAAPFDVRLAERNQTNDHEIVNVVQPYISVICDKTKLDDRGCLGAPDLIVEILSPATAVKDLMIKRDLYEHYGVKEYLLVHPVDTFVMIYILKNSAYHKAAILSASDSFASSVIPGLEINLKDIFADI